MSEQEKNNAVQAEGTVTEAPKKDPWYKRICKNQTVRRWAKRVVVGAAVIGSGLLGFEIGKHDGPGSMELLPEATAEEEPEE